MAALAGGDAAQRLPAAGCCAAATACAVTREAQARAPASCAAPGALWDGRWRVTGPEISGLEVRALGEAGLALCPDWRETGRAARGASGRTGGLAGRPAWSRHRWHVHEPDWRAEPIGAVGRVFSFHFIALNAPV